VTKTTGLIAFLWLLLVMSSPSLLALSASTYRYLTPSHLITFIVSGLTFVILGRQLKKRGHAPFWPGTIIGSATAILGSAVYQYTIRLPHAQHALSLSLHGVPPLAVSAMLHIHPVSGALIISAFSAGFYGLWGGFATWWGAQSAPFSHTPGPKDNVQTKSRT
jgi:hypothetical protein